ncbi:MAG TPA: hypothetical protein VIG97_10215 [Luteimonas sp.]
MRELAVGQGRHRAIGEGLTGPGRARIRDVMIAVGDAGEDGGPRRPVDPHAMQLKALCVPMLCVALAGLAACGQEEEAVPVGPASSPEAAPSPAPSPAVEVVEAEPTSLASLPATRQLEVLVEGQRELREATLFESPQGYAIYVLPQVGMTPEEPCCDLAYARVDDGFFMRIERIDDALDLATLRGDMQLALSNVGPAAEAPGPRFGPDVDAEVELSMRAQGQGVSMAMLVARIDGGRYRITRHLPHREALEGIAPAFEAMLVSLRTTGPKPRV